MIMESERYKATRAFDGSEDGLDEDNIDGTADLFIDGELVPIIDGFDDGLEDELDVGVKDGPADRSRYGNAEYVIDGVEGR